MKKYLLLTSLGVLISQQLSAALITDPNDARSWQGATIGTFAQLYYGSDTLTNRQFIESTVYLSNDQIRWTGAKVERVLLKGFMTNTDIKWNGFSYAVGTGTDQAFRYASVIQGAPEALQHGGDNEIKGIVAAKKDYQSPIKIPEPANLGLMFLGALGVLIHRLKYNT